MPSGAKKRKAAKKKREQQQAYHHHHPDDTTPSINPQGNDDKKVEDERDSESCELNSPASEGNPHHQHTFGEGNGSGPSPDESIVVENKINEPDESVDKKVETGEAGRSEEAGQQDVKVKIEEEDVKSDQDVKSLEVSIEHVDSEKVVHDDRSSASSSDDESSAVDNKGEELQNTAASVTPKNEEDIVDFSAEEAIPNPEANAVIPTSEEVIPNHSSNGTVKSDGPIDLDTPVASMSHVLERELEVGSSKLTDVVERGLKEIEEKLLPKSYLANEVLVPSDSGKNDVALPTFDQNVEVAVSTETVNEDKSLTSSGAVETIVNQNALDTETSVDADRAKDTMFSDSTEKQPLLASAPRVPQRTSFLNCCGLLDAFTTSDR